MAEKRCRVCGCTDSEPCIADLDDENYYWVTDDLCSFCHIADDEDS